MADADETRALHSLRLDELRRRVQQVEKELREFSSSELKEVDVLEQKLANALIKGNKSSSRPGSASRSLGPRSLSGSSGEDASAPRARSLSSDSGKPAAALPAASRGRAGVPSGAPIGSRPPLPPTSRGRPPLPSGPASNSSGAARGAPQPPAKPPNGARPPPRANHAPPQPQKPAQPRAKRTWRAPPSARVGELEGPAGEEQKDLTMLRELNQRLANRIFELESLLSSTEWSEREEGTRRGLERERSELAGTQERVLASMRGFSMAAWELSDALAEHAELLSEAEDKLSCDVGDETFGAAEEAALGALDASRRRVLARLQAAALAPR
eukprot:tig00000310_g23958.t1